MENLRAADPALAAEIERRARAWIDENIAEFPGDAETGLLGNSEAERASFEDFANEAACPALDLGTGRCDVYAWRPMTCRVFGPPVRIDAGEENGEALGHCELCFIGASPAEIAAREMPLPHELETKLLNEIGQEGETLWRLRCCGETRHSAIYVTCRMRVRLTRPSWAGKLDAQNGTSLKEGTLFSDKGWHISALDPNPNIRRLHADQGRYEPGDSSELDLDLVGQGLSLESSQREGLFAPPGDRKLHEPWFGHSHQHGYFRLRRIGLQVFRDRMIKPL